MSFLGVRFEVFVCVCVCVCVSECVGRGPKCSKSERMTLMSQFSDMTSSSNFFDVLLFLLSSLVTGPNFMLMSSLVLEL